MGLTDGWSKAASDTAAQAWETVKCALGKLVDLGQQSATATSGTARNLAYQYGVPPLTGAGDQYQPRSMTALPYCADIEVTARVTVDVLEVRGHFATSGYIANIGENEMRFAWMGVNGSTTGFIALPPASTVQVPCMIKGVLVEPVGAAGRLQVSLS